MKEPRSERTEEAVSSTIDDVIVATIFECDILLCRTYINEGVTISTLKMILNVLILIKILL